jgi:predicted transposase YdaD
MSDDPIHQPHDKLHKATFSNPENARAFFKNQLPEPMGAACAWDSLNRRLIEIDLE